MAHEFRNFHLKLFSNTLLNNLNENELIFLLTLVRSIRSSTELKSSLFILKRVEPNVRCTLECFMAKIVLRGLLLSLNRYDMILLQLLPIYNKSLTFSSLSFNK